ncbi:MAG: hypothetical protein Q9206_004632 [Seirophora lacunosa]
MADEEEVPPDDKFDGLEALQPTAAYVSKRGRHKQLINSSVLDKVMQQRKQAIEGSKQRKLLLNDQRERKRMQQYMEALAASQGSATVQTPRTPSSTIHHIKVNGLTFQILKNGSKLARKFAGPTDMSLPTPKRMTVHGVVFVRSKHGNLYRSGMIRASKDMSGAQISTLCKRFTKTGTCRKKHCGLPHIDRAGQIRKHAAQLAATNRPGNGSDATEIDDGDISSDDDDDGVSTDGEDIDSDDIADDLIEGVDALGRQALAEQHDFVGF